MSRTRSTLAVLALAAGLAAAAPAAEALTWNSASNPLLAHQDSDASNPKILAAAYGNFTKLNSTSARSAVHYQDRQPGGNKVYGETKFLFYAPSTSCSSNGTLATCFHQTANDQTGRSNSGAWEGPWNSDEGLVSDGTQARGQIHVCEDQSWAPDDCSAFVVKTFSY